VTPAHGTQYFHVRAVRTAATAVAFDASMDSPRRWPTRLFNATSGILTTSPMCHRFGRPTTQKANSWSRCPDTITGTPLWLCSDRMAGAVPTPWRDESWLRPIRVEPVDNSDSRVADIPEYADSDVYGMLAAPGVALMVRRDRTGTYVDGYA
jgi:hypothetical protein